MATLLAAAAAADDERQAFLQRRHASSARMATRHLHKCQWTGYLVASPQPAAPMISAQTATLAPSDPAPPYASGDRTGDGSAMLIFFSKRR